MATGTDNREMQFTGKERDAETGLDYFGARYFSAAQGRFTSPDRPFADQIPEDPQSWNLYVYVRNNPLRYTDPTGGACFDGRGAASCGNYILGGLKEVANIPSNLATSINRVIDPAIAWTGVQFGAAPTFQPANVDQAEGMEAAAVVMLVSPLAEAGAAKVAGLGRASSAATKTAAATETGVVYELPPQAASGKPYVGRTARSVEERMATRTDGRTGPAKPVDTFNAQDRAHGQYKEQKAINARGGVQNLSSAGRPGPSLWHFGRNADGEREKRR